MAFSIFTPMFAALVGLATVCRYTVRDIGFVDLTGPLYELVLAGASDEALARLTAPARDSNVAVVRGEGGASVRWTLRRSGLEPLALAATTPEVALEEALHSPLRDDMASRALVSFAFLLVVDGTDNARDDDMQRGLSAASEGLAAIESQLPRPIRLPLVRLRVARDGREAERVLLWSLGLHAPRAEPVVCVLYGRGKLAGDPITLAKMAQGELLAQLALVGETCECDTTRAWMAEPTVPLAWSERTRASAWDALGFDPESPMVKAEVTRILARGPGTGGESARPDSIEALVFGYREARLTPSVPGPRVPGEPGPEERVPEEGVFAEGAPRASTVYEAGEGDWGFDEAPAQDPPSQAQAQARARAETEAEAEQAGPRGASILLILAGLGLASAGFAAAVLLRRRA